VARKQPNANTPSTDLVSRMYSHEIACPIYLWRLKSSNQGK
jgi:hypothetical protein